MLIADVKTHVLQADLGDNAFGWSQRVGNSRQTAICVVETDEGLRGVGEAFYFGGPSAIVAQLIDRGLGPLITGRDPFDTSVIWDTLYNWTRDQGQKGLTISAISAIDIALWDLAGKAAGLPVYRLLGGAFRDRVQPYATGFYRISGQREAARLADEARAHLAAGFRVVRRKTHDALRHEAGLRFCGYSDLSVLSGSTLAA